MKSIIIILALVVGLNSPTITFLYQFLTGAQLSAEYVPPDTGNPPAGDGSGSRT